MHLINIWKPVIENRNAPILSHINPLSIQPLTLTRRDNGSSFVKPKHASDKVREIGISLLQILQNEYGDEYRPGRTIDEAQSAMMKINPYLVKYTPKDAIAALKE